MRCKRAKTSEESRQEKERRRTEVDVPDEQTQNVCISSLLHHSVATHEKSVGSEGLEDWRR